MIREMSPAEIGEILRAAQSPRYTELDVLQRVFDGTVYDGRPAWLDNGSDAPLQERRPCVIFPVVAAGIESNVALAMGEGKFPTILSLSSEDDSDNGGLSAQDSVTFDAFNARLIDCSGIEGTSRQLLRMGQASRSGCAILGFRKGMPNVETVWAKTATPTFNPSDPDEVINLEISFRYVTPIFDGTQGKWIRAVYQYRRVIDAQSDTTFLPVLIQDKTAFPVPNVPDKTRTVNHGFGFCPVKWWACLGSTDPGSGFDGHAIHDRTLDAIMALDMALSQRHRAALYAGDPQWVGTGIDPANPFGPSGRTAIPATPDNPTGDPRKAGPWGGAMFGAGTKGATKKGPGVFWAIENPDAKFQLFALPGDALDAIDKHAQDLLNKICEAMHVVRLDPVALRGTADISAKAMVLMYAKQLGRVAQLRQDFGDKCLLPILNLFYRMMLAKPAGVFVPGLAKALPILARCQMATTSGPMWFAPKLKLKWPEYFEPSDLDETARVNNSKAAYDAGFVTLATAVEHIKSVFSISNVDQYVDQLAKEKVQRQADAVATAQAMAKAAPQAAPAGNGAKTPPQPTKKAPGAKAAA